MPAISASRPRIVDADGHVLEHPTAMLEYMPERYKKRCFHVETDAERHRVVLLRRPQDVREPDGARGRGRHDARGAPARAQGRDALFGHPLGRVRPGAAPRRDGAGRHRAGGRLPDPVPRHLEPPRPRLRRGAGARLQPLGRRLLQRRADAPVRDRGRAADRPRALHPRSSRTRASSATSACSCARTRTSEGSWFCDGSYDRLWAALQDLDLAVGFHPYPDARHARRRAPARPRTSSSRRARSRSWR